MFKINKKLEYALMVLKHLHDAAQGQHCSARIISQQHHLPFDTVSRVMQQMTHCGYLKAVHGAQGGYAMAIDLADVSFGELSRVILGEMSVADCLHSKATCVLLPTCNIVSPVMKIQQEVLDLCSRLTLKDLLEHRLPTDSFASKWRSSEKEVADVVCR